MSRYHQTNEATMITMMSQSKKSRALEQFLKSGGDLVKQNEPNTKVWFALKDDKPSFIIFDAFYDKAGRDAHFSGQVAAALKGHAEELVHQGWDKGVLSNIKNSKVLSAKIPDETTRVSLANYIQFQAKEGQSKQLAALLSKAAEIVDANEPNTLYWFALQVNETTFAIFDAFADEAGQSEHFSGKVASLLKENAQTMIVNGWQKGVVSGIKNLEVIYNK